MPCLLRTEDTTLELDSSYAGIRFASLHCSNENLEVFMDGEILESPTMVICGKPCVEPEHTWDLVWFGLEVQCKKCGVSGDIVNLPDPNWVLSDPD
jgi:hypothetical protein